MGVVLRHDHSSWSSPNLVMRGDKKMFGGLGVGLCADAGVYGCCVGGAGPDPDYDHKTGTWHGKRNKP